MQVLRVRNVHDAIRQGMDLIKQLGVEQDSRVGKVLSSPEPVTTVYEKPTERVVFWKERDANPFFHFMESLWMLAGRNDVAWVAQFSANIAQFSDDGKTFHGPYGYRWINHFVKENEDENVFVPFNQLEKIVEMLKANPRERRCVLQMWDAEVDLGRNGKDVPCNTQIYFKLSQDNKLNMTVLNRSNDLIWGAYGANAVHMSMLQEFMASWVGVEVGRYWQVSNDWHAYIEVFKNHEDILTAPEYNPYSYKQVEPFPMVNGPIEEWIEDLFMFMDEGPTPTLRDKFFRRVAAPIWNAWFIWKDKSNPNRIDEALEQLKSCSAADWRLACEEWLERRRK